MSNDFFAQLNAEADKRLSVSIEVKCPTCHGHKFYREHFTEPMKRCGDCNQYGNIIQKIEAPKNDKGSEAKIKRQVQGSV